MIAWSLFFLTAIAVWHSDNYATDKAQTGSQDAPLELQDRPDALKETTNVACTHLREVTKEFSLHIPSGFSVSSIGYS